MLILESKASVNMMDAVIHMQTHTLVAIIYMIRLFLFTELVKME